MGLIELGMCVLVLFGVFVTLLVAVWAVYRIERRWVRRGGARR
jgi:hypothetical protein